jgi:hypothetical protein
MNLGSVARGETTIHSEFLLVSNKRPHCGPLRESEDGAKSPLLTRRATSALWPGFQELGNVPSVPGFPFDFAQGDKRIGWVTLAHHFWIPNRLSGQSMGWSLWCA